jgi:hypothetical protein
MFSSSDDLSCLTLTNTIIAIGLASTLALGGYYLHSWFTERSTARSPRLSHYTGGSGTLKRRVIIAATTDGGVLDIHAHGYNDPWTEEETTRTAELITKLQQSYSTRWPWQRSLKGDRLSSWVVKKFTDSMIFPDTEIEAGPTLGTALDLEEYRELFYQEPIQEQTP